MRIILLTLVLLVSLSTSAQVKQDDLIGEWFFCGTFKDYQSRDTLHFLATDTLRRESCCMVFRWSLQEKGGFAYSEHDYCMVPLAGVPLKNIPSTWKMKKNRINIYHSGKKQSPADSFGISKLVTKEKGGRTELILYRIKTISY